MSAIRLQESAAIPGGLRERVVSSNRTASG